MRRLLLPLFIFSLLTFPCSAWAEDQREVKGSYINVRKEGSFKSPVVTKKLRGDNYSVHFERNGWAKVTFGDGTEGWIYLTLIERAGERAKAKKTESEKPTEEKKEPKKTAKSQETEKAKGVKDSQDTEDGKEKKAVSRKEKQKGGDIKTPEMTTIKPLPETPEPPAQKTTSKTAEEFYNEAIQLYEGRHFAEALEANRSALKQAPRNAEILNNLGNCLFKMGRIDDAIKEWRNALEISPKSAKICNNLGIAYYQIDENSKAIEYYKKAILFEPKFPDPYYNLASVHGFLGQFDKALESYQKFLETGPDKTMRRLTEERIDYCKKQIDRVASTAGEGKSGPEKIEGAR